MPINRAHRLIYRNRPDLQRAYPDPFAGDTGDEKTYVGWCKLRGPSAYPDLFPEPSASADWQRLTEFLVPSIAPPEGALPNLRERLMKAALDARQARALAQQTAGVMRREGVRGLWSRLKRVAGG